LADNTKISHEEREYVVQWCYYSLSFIFHGEVLAIFEKNIGDLIYKKIKHVAKGLNLKHIQMPEEIKNMIDLKDCGD